MAGTTKLAALATATTALGLIAAGCGNDEPGATEGAGTPAASEFPPAKGKTLQQIASEASGPSELAVVPANQVFEPGTNRLAIGVFTLDHTPVDDAELAVYAARPDGKARGPYPATAHPLTTDGGFRSESTANDPDAAKVIYTTEVDLDEKGEWRLLAMVREPGGELGSATVGSAVVGRFEKVPLEGEKAPVVHTPTVEQVGGDLTKLDTRQPPSSMHEVDFADVVGKKPVVLLFATAALCQTRVCGPVIDITEQIKNERGDEAEFVHMEIYEDNDVNKGLRDQVKAFNLPSEPWAFVIDENGKVSTALEGAFGADELNAALDKVTSESNSESSS